MTNATRSGTRRISATPPEPRACVGCGKLFMPVKFNQTRHVAHCGRARVSDQGRTSSRRNGVRARKRAGPQSFIAIDGEGVTDTVTGEHRYVLLTCGHRHLSQDGLHLKWNEIFDFLWSCFEEDYLASDKHPAYVGFYLKYDFAQWVRTLPENRARFLFTPSLRKHREPHREPHPVRHAGWEFDYLVGKRFRLRPEGRTRISTMEKGKLKTPWMHICDAGAYFQSSFLKAIELTNNPNPVVTPEEYAIIERGKERRQNAEFDQHMIEYNLLECEVLSRLMGQLESGIREEGLKPSRKQWHGPGQVAQLWLRKIGAPTGEQLRKIIPEPVREAARASYYGGWFETFWHGPTKGTSYGYDINSAYPHVMSGLPCLLHANWKHRQEKSGGRKLTWTQKDELLALPWTLVRAELKGHHRVVGAMLHRNRNKTIARPGHTIGWFWTHELRAAVEAGFVEDIRLFDVREFVQSCDCPPPLAPIAELYAGRIEVGKASPQGKARKLIYNSCAGKTQQSVGEPIYANPVYASLITAGCRTIITEAIGSHHNPLDLLMVATDSVVFRTPHKGLELDRERLGAWTETTHENQSLFMPGVYWDDAARERIRLGQAGIFKSRGISARDLNKHISEIDAAWGRFKQDGWPKMTLDVSFQLVSPKQALARKRWDLCGVVISADRPETWQIDDQGNPKEPVRIINADPKMKRIASRPGRSHPWPRCADLESLPYEGTFGDEIREEQEKEYGDNPDGWPGGMIPEALLGE